MSSNNSSKKNAGNSGGNKSKKSKNDIFRQAVGMHLKQKCYVGNEKYRKSDFLLQQNKKQFALQKMLEADLQCGNSFTYSLVSLNNQHIVDQQFARFTQFVESQKSPVMRAELKRFYGPIICHQYLDFLKAQEPKMAADFLKKYAGLIASVDTYDAPLPMKMNGCTGNNDVHSEPVTNTNAFNLNIRYTREANLTEDVELDFFIKLVQTLSTCTKLEAAEENLDILNYRSTKYEIHTTETVVQALNNYLEKKGHVVIFNLIYSWIHLHIINNDVGQLTEETLFFGPCEDDIEMYEQNPKILLNSAVDKHQTTIKRPTEEMLVDQPIKKEVVTEEKCDIEQQKASCENNARMCIDTLKKSREQIFKTQLEFPRFIKVANKCKGLTSAHLDANECHMVAGFNSSIVQLWQLNQHTTMGRNFYSSRRELNCPWELNNCLNDELDTVENDVEMHAKKQERRARLLQEKYYEKKYVGNSYNEFGGIQLRGHTLGVTDVRFSRFYPLIYSVSKDSTIRCWRAENYACSSIYRGHNYAIWCIDESPVNLYLATGSKDLTARLWSLEKQYPLITYVGHTQDVECLAFHPNGNYIATGSADLSVRLWCVTSGSLMRVFSDCKQSVCCVAFSPDGKLLAAGGEESKIRIFDIAAGAQLHELKDHTASVASIAWSVNGRHLTSVCRDGTFRLWDVKKLTQMHETGSSTNCSNAPASSSSSPATTNRLLAFNSNCQTFVKVFYSANETICAIGS